MDNNLKEKTYNALKWSSLAEILAKLVTPVVNMILARLLTPETFGVVATVTMVISFADMFSDSGFQKFLIQYDFKDKKALYKSATVAFTTNLLISIFLWGIIACFNSQIASFVGNPGKGIVIVVAGISLPLTSFSSIQSAIYRRKFDFKTIFVARIAMAISPLIITVPLAVLGFQYWSIIAGNICGNLFTAIILTVKSEWKPRLLFDLVELKRMFSFSMWSLVESLGTWLTSYVGTFIVGNLLNQYYLGLYKTTVTTVNGIFALVTSATTTVLFSMLSRLQNNKDEYNRAYLRFIKAVSILIIPLGFGIFIYRDLVTKILLGSQWLEAIPFVRIYGLMSCLALVYGQYASEYYRGLGKPKASVLTTVIHLAALIPVLIICARQGFLPLVYGRSLVKIEQIAAFWIVLWIWFRFNPFQLISYTYKSIICSIIMAVAGFFMLRVSTNIIFEIFSACICIVIYFVLYGLVFRGKNDLKAVAKMLKRK